MTIGQFMDYADLEKTLLMGYYGGGNYGDELLLEVMQNMLAKKGVKNAQIAYMPYCNFATYHHNFGYKHFKANSVLGLLGAILRSKNVIVGGGGIWGLDAKLQPLLMSIALFAARWFFGKKVYLLGVGYYGSTNWYGHVGAWLAAMASNVIIARDLETLNNFKKFKLQKVYHDVDIAWYARQIDLSLYQQQLKRLESDIGLINKKTILVTLRRFNPKHSNDFNRIISSVINQNPDFNIIAAILEPKAMDRQNYSQLQQWQKLHQQLRVLDFSYNPLALLMFLQKYKQHLAVISPQFHLILSAHLHNLPFLPVVYDNKVSQLLDQIGQTTRYSIYDLALDDVNKFVRSLA